MTTCTETIDDVMAQLIARHAPKIDLEVDGCLPDSGLCWSHDPCGCCNRQVVKIYGRTTELVLGFTLGSREIDSIAVREINTGRTLFTLDDWAGLDLGIEALVDGELSLIDEDDDDEEAGE